MDIPGLAATDAEALEGLFAVLVVASSVAAFRAFALAGLRKLIPCDLASHYEVDVVTGKPNAIVFGAEALFEGAEEAWASTLGDDPFMRYYEETRDGRAVKLSDFIADRELADHPKHAAVYGPLGMNRKISIVVEEEAPPGVSAATRPRISLYRRGEDFSERDRALLDAARPRLARIREEADLRSRTREVSTAAAETGGGRWGLLVGPRTLVDDDDFELENVTVRELDVRSERLEAELQAGRAAAIRRKAGLTARETQVLDLLVQGRSDHEIATALGISPRTVGKHLEHVYAKLGVQRRAEAIYRAR